MLFLIEQKDSEPRDPFFKPHCLHLDNEVVFLATRKLYKLTGNKRMLSSFVNRILEEFVLEDQEKETSIQQMARDLTQKIRLEKAQQRKIVEDKEAERIELEREALDQQKRLERITRDAVRRLEFKREYLRDRDHMCWSKKRDDLCDEVSLEIRKDLQWKDLYPIVAAVVLEGGES